MTDHILENQKLIKAKEKLRELREKQDNISDKALLKSLKNDIKEARKAGKTWKQITEALKEAGIKVSVPTLSNNFGDTKKKKNENKTAKKSAKPVQTTPKPKAAPQAAPPVVPPGQFVIRPDRGADL